MYINRALLLVAALVVIFYPTIAAWMFTDETSWYRPYLLWLMAIVAAAWNQRSRQSDEL